MRLALVGADFEENLGMAMIASSASAHGHAVTITPFNRRQDLEKAATRILGAAPDVVGLSMQFQHRAFEFLTLSRRLRALGFAGHITCGGQLPSLAWQEVLSPGHGIDSVVLHEGEATIVELLAALASGSAIANVPGLAVRDEHGAPQRTQGRALIDDLDALPFPARYRAHTRHAGVPFIPIMGGRGCWGSCSYCSITSFYRDARAYGGAKFLRHRSPRDVAEEMAVLWHAAGGQGIFCFHDDNLLLPRPEASLVRMREIRACLDELGVGRVGIVGKSRPECLTDELARELRSIGVIRLYVGIENASSAGASHLRRGSQFGHIRSALRACHQAGIFVCYNLLVFEPDATVDDVRANVSFIRENARHPMNFCRAEPYHGTPLYHDLARRGALRGSYLGYDYRCSDDRAELLFRICSAAFRPRNFDGDGVGNRYMGLGYMTKVLEQFIDSGPALKRIARRAEQLTQDIALDTASFLEHAIHVAETADPRDGDRLEREVCGLGLQIAAADAVWHARLDEVFGEIEAFAHRTPRTSPDLRPSPELRAPRGLFALARKVTLGASLAASAAGTVGCSSVVGDDVPSDRGVDAVDAWRLDVVDDVPADFGVDEPRDARDDMFVVDDVPPDVGMDMTVVDIAPPDAGLDTGSDAGTDAALDGAVDAAVDAAVDGRTDAPASASRGGRRLPVVDHWRDTTPSRTRRSDDLPLWSPLAVELSARREGDLVRVRLTGASEVALGTRWEGDGQIDGSGRDATWLPSKPTDHLRVAVRARGGVAVVFLRAADVE